MVQYSPVTDTIKAAIRQRIAPELILSTPAELAQFAGDASTLTYTPELVVRAQSVGDIQALLELANIYRFPVTPRGGGSGLAGGCLPSLGGVVLLTGGLNRITAIDGKNFVMKVEPGVISQQVRLAADAAGLFYPPDPAGMDLSTIGGNAATDAGGPACVKYGTTRDYILGLEAVLPSGQLITTGVQTRKGVVGYDLTNLLVGSEGTLGIITSLTLKLLAKPAATQGMMCVFRDMVSAMNCVAAIMGQGYLPSAIEFLDHRCLSLIGELLPFSLPPGKSSILIVEVDGPESQVAAEMEAICAIARAEAAIELIKANSTEEREKIWAVRRQVSLRIHDYAKLYIPEDIVVPLTAIAELVDALPFYEEKYGIEVFAFGHAGDGNIHLNITTQSLDRQDLAHEGTRALLDLTLRLQGTISGEHGIGLAKAPYLSMELSPHSIELQRSIKKLFDPNLVLNPGKIFPED
ncbi:FAD-binding protein [Desulfopila sp. IMCC35006]|uniref:FAD-binding oxidoreductase n=1 Tax=Desulfopila sp. IMCC35006 TaxID=2569542 RepID=UPI0010AD9065|nr:FAD-linked oxidase C-terminal domain-containing protein [Desulfopila sp. IMCC35006]TKB26303.1 FAD-binding protein [Desulfopila sp. IMCC35006]